jgi:hypothetical protein
MITSNLKNKYDYLARDTLHNRDYHDAHQEVGSSGNTSGLYSELASSNFSREND